MNDRAGAVLEHHRSALHYEESQCLITHTDLTEGWSDSLSMSTVTVSRCQLSSDKREACTQSAPKERRRLASAIALALGDSFVSEKLCWSAWHVKALGGPTLVVGRGFVFPRLVFYLSNPRE